MTITIVGAGIIGCAVAHELASRGAAVHVLDPRGIARGATYASAGMLAPHIEGHLPALLHLSLRSLAMYDAFVARVRAGSMMPIEYARRGTLQVAFTPAEHAQLGAAAKRLDASQTANEFLAGAAARRLEPALSEGVTGALLVPEHGYVAVRALTLALAEAATRRGARFSVARVEALEHRAEGVVLRTSIGPLSADAVVVAAGSWSPHLAGAEQVPPPVAPIRGQLVQVSLPAPIVSRVLWGPRCYLVPWETGAVLAGATVEDVGFDQRATVDGVRGLLDGAAALVPQLGAARFDEVRVGLRPRTADELPIIGRSTTTPQVVYATGHYRNGILLAPLTAKLVADLIVDGEAGEELTLTAPARVGL